MALKSILDILSFKNLKPAHWVAIFSLFVFINIPVILHDNGHSNAYSLLAESLCKGELTLSPKEMPYVRGTDVRNTGDLIFYHNKYYLPYPPAPALLLTPFVLIGHGYVNSILISVLLTCLNILLLFKILRKLDINQSKIPWLIYAFFFGTSYWYVLVSSHYVYGFAEIISVTFLLLLLNELFGKHRGVLLGIFLGTAFLSRQFTIFIGLFVIGYVSYQYLIRAEISKRDIRTLVRKLLSFSGTIAAFIIIYFLYNYERFGNPLETGYQYISFLGVLKIRVEEHGIFSSHYVLYNLYNYLIKGFNIEFTGSNLLQVKDMDPFGTSLLAASPFILAAAKTGWSRPLRIFAWTTISIIFIGLLFYHNNGKNQVNASRFTLDFLPLLFVLVSKGAKNIPAWIFKSMIIYSIILNILALAIHGYYHTLIN